MNLKFHISFWIAAAAFCALGLGMTFLMLAASITAHELAHILTAKAFGCKIRHLAVSVLGEMTLVEHMDKIGPWKRAAIIAAGPACNLLLWCIIGGQFGFYNLVLAGFNMLPVFPLDGARLFQLLAGNTIGAMRANRLIMHSGRVCCVVLILMGIVQAALYAPNFTMLAAGIFLWHRNRSQLLNLTGEFYMAMLKKTAKLSKEPMPVKFLYTSQNQPIASIVDTMGWDNILIVITPGGQITEEEILNYVLKNSISANISEVQKSVCAPLH